MLKRKGRLILIGLTVVAATLVIVYTTRSSGVSAELAVVKRTGLRTVVRAEGQTRVEERYVFTAPVSGQLLRIDAQPGDSVRTGDVLFRILPPPDSEQSLRVARARLEAARSQVMRMERMRDDARAAAEQAARTLERQRVLAAEEILSPQELEQAELAAASARRQWDAAESAFRAAVADAQSAEALALADESERMQSGISVRAVEAGVLLSIRDRSGRVVAAGEPILETGNLERMEVVVDVLSEDAVQIRPGNPVALSGWGEEGVLEARVRYVEPAAFTKWSALGVEEQRVNVVIDLVSTGAPWADGPDEQPSAPITGRLGDGYRVDADIEIWSSDDALTVPVSAVFREAGEWFVFVVVKDTAEKRSVSLGRRSSEAAVVLSGLQAGDVVIRYPTADIAPGVRIRNSPRSRSDSYIPEADPDTSRIGL